MFYWKPVLKNFAKFTGKHLRWNLLNFSKFFRTPMLWNICGWLPLYLVHDYLMKEFSLPFRPRVIEHHFTYCILLCNGTSTHNQLVRKRTLKHLAKLASLAKWLSVLLRIKWLWVRVPLQSLWKLQHFQSMFGQFSTLRMKGLNQFVITT